MIATKDTIHHNLSSDELIQQALVRKEAVLAANGALAAVTGKRTGRSPKDRFIVKDSLTENTVAWGAVNQAISAEVFQNLWKKAENYIQEREYFVSDLQVGASPEHFIPVKVVTEWAWHQLFCRNLFIRKQSSSNKPTWTLLSVPGLTTDPAIDGVNSDACLILNFSQKKILLCGLRYAGEMKKALFSVLNFLLTDEDILPMHCAANVGEDGKVALFFGLSGTGKTTLSSDPERFLIGDDEHGWAVDQVFNFEGGCYAKCIDLSREREPVIWDAIKHGAIMENVVLNAKGEPDYKDASHAENSRAAYPREHIEKRVEKNYAGKPSAVIFLTCDLYGVLPPVAKLTKEQAAYYFLSGYTAKVAGTEIGTPGVAPTFSTCFGAPFFPRDPSVYAKLLMKRIEETHVDVYLVNTGWTGGAVNEGGQRFSIPTTRAIVRAITQGDLKHAQYENLDGFNLAVPSAVPGVDPRLLMPKNTWANVAAYEAALKTLMQQFIENFKKFKVDEKIQLAGPNNKFL